MPNTPPAPTPLFDPSSAVPADGPEMAGGRLGLGGEARNGGGDGLGRGLAFGDGLGMSGDWPHLDGA